MLPGFLSEDDGTDIVYDRQNLFVRRTCQHPDIICIE